MYKRQADISSISEVFQSYSSINFGNYSNEEMDKELILGRSAYKIEDRAPHYRRFKKLQEKIYQLYSYGILDIKLQLRNILKICLLIKLKMKLLHQNTL